MSRFFYDLHLHSCLSPCGDDESTPNSIAGMGKVNGLDLMALTDHNTCQNCPAFFKAAERYDIIPIAGMELTTAEEIHVICLFETLKAAMTFDRIVDKRRVKIPNRTDIFGCQLRCDENDCIIGSEEHFLSNATTVSLEETPKLVHALGGICYPAHVDREANGVISILGVFPKFPIFSYAEVRDATRRMEFSSLCGLPEDHLIVSSDAHYLWDIQERTQWFYLPVRRQELVHALFKEWRVSP